jgi:hypothetical protein
MLKIQQSVRVPAILGTAIGALSGGSVGQGAIYGTAIGAGLGVAKANY